jgi:ribosomal protein S15P/S13E
MALPPHFIDLVQDALLKSFWTKKALRNFLRRSHVSDNFLSQLPTDEKKREWLDRLFPKLEASDRGQALIQQMARSLADQTSFPDLTNWEDSSEKIRAAQEAVKALKDYLARKDEDKEQEREAAERRRLAEERRQNTIRSKVDLAVLKSRLDALCQHLGTQQGGYSFQDWFYDLMDYFEVDNRRPYVVDGRQIDGSITIDGTTYLVELKFTATQADAPDIDSLLKKVNDKADNTMGVMVSMSSFSSVALSEASFSKSPLLLLDHSHLYMVLGEIISFPDAMRRIRRHSSQEGKAFLAATEFGGR